MVTCALSLEDICLEVTHATAAYISLAKASIIARINFKWAGESAVFWIQEGGELDISEQH